MAGTATLLVSLAALTVAGGPAAAEDRGRLDDMSVKLAVTGIFPDGGHIRVVSSDGMRWNAIRPTSLPLAGTVQGDMKAAAGKIKGFHLRLGVCGQNQCLSGAFPLIHGPITLGDRPRDFKRNIEFSFNTGVAPVSGGGGIAASPDFDVMIGACNALLAKGASINKNNLIPDMKLHVTLALDTRYDAPTAFDAGGDSPGDADWTQATPVTVNVMCEAAPPMIEAPPTPRSVEIRVKPDGGNTCPRETKVTAYVDYEEKTTARLRANYNGQIGGPMTVNTREVTLFGKTWHRAEQTFTYYLDPGEHKFRVEVENGPKSEWANVEVACPPFKVTSTWMKYQVEDKPTCPKKVVETVTFKATRPGKFDYRIKHQGGLVAYSGTAEAKRQGLDYVAEVKRNLTMGAFDAEMMAELVNDPAANSGWMRLKVECLEVLGGLLNLREFAPSACKGEAAISIRTNAAATVPYRLDCTGGRSWSRHAQAHQTAPGTFIAVDTFGFAVSNNEQVNCTLKSLVTGQPKVLALRGHKYACHKRQVEPGAGDLTGDRTPTPTTGTPPVIVTPPPQPPKTASCEGGKLVSTRSRPPQYACNCPPRWTKTQTGLNAWQCRAPTVTTCQAGQHLVSGKCVKDEPKVTCAGGTVKAGSCQCPSGAQPVKAADNAWRCVRKVAEPRVKAAKQVGSKPNRS